MTKITATKGTETLTFQFEQEDKASVVIRYYLKKGYTVTVNDGDETHTLKPDFPKLTPAQERTWKLVQDWHKKHGKVYAGFTPAGHSNFGVNIAGVFGITETEATIKAMVKKGLLVSVGKGIVPNAPWMECYAIHPDFVPEYFDNEPATPAPEPDPAAAPAPVNNAPVKSLIDAGMGYTERYKPENWRSEPPVSEPAPTNPTYDSLKALADKQDEYIQGLENALRSALVNGKTYLREVDRLGARIAELETENADLRGDMERLAASELELVQQNALLNSVVDRLSKRTDAVVAAANDACAEYGGDMAEDAMHTLADTIGYPWN